MPRETQPAEFAAGLFGNLRGSLPNVKRVNISLFAGRSVAAEAQGWFGLTGPFLAQCSGGPV